MRRRPQRSTLKPSSSLMPADMSYTLIRPSVEALRKTLGFSGWNRTCNRQMQSREAAVRVHGLGICRLRRVC